MKQRAMGGGIVHDIDAEVGIALKRDAVDPAQHQVLAIIEGADDGDFGIMWFQALLP